MTNNKSAGASLSPWAERIDFKMFSSDIMAVKTADGNFDDKRPQVYGIGSSELEDMAGDRMLMSAMQDMANFSVRSAIWLNHKYDVPDDIFGALKLPPTIKIEHPSSALGISKASKPFYAVGITVDVSKNNPPAMKTWNILTDDEIRLGFSIGCEITDYEIRKDALNLPIGLDVVHLRTLEWSVVGIPCNTESWIQNWAEKAYKGLVSKKANLPVIKSGSDLLYTAKNFGDFDDITGLYLRRVNDSPQLAYVVTQFDEIRENHGDDVASFFETFSVPLQKHGYCIAKLPNQTR